MLNGGTFRGNASGFQLDTLVKLKDTRTGKGPTCPTLLHYLAKVLLRTNATLVLFLEDLPSLEAATRCTSPPINVPAHRLPCTG